MNKMRSTGVTPSSTEEYQKKGYFVVKSMFSSEELDELHTVLLQFHESWIKDNTEFYNSHAVNSAYLTGKKHLGAPQRMVLFQFITHPKIMEALAAVIPQDPAFMNTQLFFNPVNVHQKNYWHRDIQYNDMPIEEQKNALSTINVVHYRIPLMPEYGIELVPGSHRRWDSEEEFAVRMELQEKKCFEDLSTGATIPLERGDMLVFSANMIHRGLYGRDRFALDILFCDSTPELLEYADQECLPDSQEMRLLENRYVFSNTMKGTPHNKKMIVTNE